MSTSADVPPSGPLVADSAADAIGGRASVRPYYDENESHCVTVLTCDGAPTEGWITCSTTTLHLAPNLLGGKDIRVELLATARKDDEGIANVVATAGFFVMKDGWLATPGVVFQDQVSEFFPTTTTPHIMIRRSDGRAPSTIDSNVTT